MEKKHPRYSVLAVETPYWPPGTDLDRMLEAYVRGKVEDGDVVVFSEKALATAKGNIVDESKIVPSLQARFLAAFWMRYFWGYLLGPFCRMGRRSIERFRNYPAEGSAHKQLALSFSGPLQALRHGSEGGIDVSNLPFSYACLPLGDAAETADSLRSSFARLSGKRVSAMIVDSDKTYSFFGFHFTPRPRPLKGIASLGIAAYALGRFLRLRRRATPLAVSGSGMRVEEALEIAELADRARGYGSGRTAWDMAERYGVGITCVTWEMLASARHFPVVIVRRKP
ncbi:MAG: coenzyme F420-0:L-glutamate ligase [Candidatus Brockarchaeota archaeon]|nr:coenzyme F420-0:L-glutamate ligase [Candidatus Brockarchaeota archaeon]